MRTFPLQSRLLKRDLQSGVYAASLGDGKPGNTRQGPASRFWTLEPSSGAISVQCTDSTSKNNNSHSHIAVTTLIIANLIIVGNIVVGRPG